METVTPKTTPEPEPELTPEPEPTPEPTPEPEPEPTPEPEPCYCINQGHNGSERLEAKVTLKKAGGISSISFTVNGSTYL